MLFNLSSKNNTVIYPQNVKKQHHDFTAKLIDTVYWIPTDSAWPQFPLATQILLL